MENFERLKIKAAYAYFSGIWKKCCISCFVSDYKYCDFLNLLYLEDNENDYYIYIKDFNR